MAPLFVNFVGIEGDVLDVGCGTGALTLAVAGNAAAARIVGVDLSEGFVNYARAHNPDPRVDFVIGDAQDLPCRDGVFDRCLILLAINFIPDAPRAVREMRRVTRPGGVVGTASWDNGGHNRLNQCLWDAAAAVDPDVTRPEGRYASYGTAEGLSNLWSAGGLAHIEVTNLKFPCGFSSFDDFWLPLVEGQGPAGSYLSGLAEEHRNALRERLGENILGRRSDGPFTLEAKAWAVRGTVPDR